MSSVSYRIEPSTISTTLLINSDFQYLGNEGVIEFRCTYYGYILDLIPGRYLYLLVPLT